LQKNKAALSQMLKHSRIGRIIYYRSIDIKKEQKLSMPMHGWMLSKRYWRVMKQKPSPGWNYIASPL
jgi:hypothetical protein